MAAFYAIAMVRTQRGHEEISAFRALGKTNPVLAFLITVCFASLAGVPLTYGFIVKFDSFCALINAYGIAELNCWFTTLLFIMILGATVGFLSSVAGIDRGPAPGSVALGLETAVAAAEVAVATIRIMM